MTHVTVVLVNASFVVKDQSYTGNWNCNTPTNTNTSWLFPWWHCCKKVSSSVRSSWTILTSRGGLCTHKAFENEPIVNQLDGKLQGHHYHIYTYQTYLSFDLSYLVQRSSDTLTTKKTSKWQFVCLCVWVCVCDSSSTF